MAGIGCGVDAEESSTGFILYLISALTAALIWSKFGPSLFGPDLWVRVSLKVTH